MPSIYSTIVVSEPDYGERIVRVHGGLHRGGVSETDGVDLVTGERLRMPISSRWDSDTQRDTRVAAAGWSWRSIPLAEAEKRAGLPRGSLPPYSESSHTDLWADERMRNPAFIALLTVLTAHPEIVFYHVDWRNWVHEQNPREYPHLEHSERLEAPKQTAVHDDGRHLPYPLGGGGYMERYASYLCRLLAGASSPSVIAEDEQFATLSAAVLADIEQHYDSVVNWQRSPDPFRRLHRSGADMPVFRSLAEIVALLWWTPEILAELDAEHTDAQERLATETAAYRPQGVALALF